MLAHTHTHTLDFEQVSGAKNALDMVQRGQMCGGRWVESSFVDIDSNQSSAGRIGALTETQTIRATCRQGRRHWPSSGALATGRLITQTCVRLFFAEGGMGQLNQFAVIKNTLRHSDLFDFIVPAPWHTQSGDRAVTGRRSRGPEMKEKKNKKALLMPQRRHTQCASKRRQDDIKSCHTWPSLAHTLAGTAGTAY